MGNVPCGRAKRNISTMESTPTIGIIHYNTHITKEKIFNNKIVEIVAVDMRGVNCAPT